MKDLPRHPELNPGLLSLGQWKNGFVGRNYCTDTWTENH